MKTNMNFVRAIVPSSAMALALLLVGTGTAQAETYTGCVTPGGTIVHLAAGESPAKACSKNQHVIHLDDRHAYQNPDAHYNHAKVCEAFHELFVDAAIIEAMGCPSDPAVVEPGTVQRVGSDDLVNSNFNVCGILKVEQNDDWGPGFQWVVDGRTGDPLPELGGGYVAKHVKLPKDSAPPNTAIQQCKKLCDDDPKCIAAQWYVTSSRSKTGDCEIFQFSDTVPHSSAGYCGMSAGFQFAGCASNLLGDPGENAWFVRCDGPLVP